MLHSLSRNIAVFLFDDNDKFPLEVYIYGIEICLSSLIGIIAILIISFMIGRFFEGILYIITLFIIRSCTGGYHAQTYFKCNLIYIFSFLCTIKFYNFLSKQYLIFNNYFCLIIMIISIIIIWLYAPVENVNKKINEKSKKKFKRLSIIEIVLSSFVAILILCMFHFYQALVIFPTFFVIDISVLVEVILSKRRNKKWRNQWKWQKKLLDFLLLNQLSLLVGQHHYVAFASPKNLSYSETIL